MALSRPDRRLSVEEKIERARREKVTYLDLSNNQLMSVPESLAQLAELQTLDLSNNELTSVPKSLGQLVGLQTLDLSNNALTSIPESLGRLVGLQKLYLYDNQLTSVPGSLRLMSGLQELLLSNNELASVPESLGKLANLQMLSLSGNQLASVPESLGQLADLRGLYLYDNQLASVPESLSRLAELRQLNLGRNQLTSIPESLSQLANLQTLFLNRNQLTSIPESLGQLSGLQTLDLSDNQLSHLPQELLKLQLSQLFLHENDSLKLPLEILGPSRSETSLRNREKDALPTDILAYYFRTQKQSRPLNEGKLILVGRGEAGKTSLVNRLTEGTFESTTKTEGIKVTHWEFSLFGQEEVRLNVWDFGGQEIMHATHQFFLTKRSLYLVVIHGREGGEDADAEYWLSLIKNFGDSSPVIVVLNKIKEHHFTLNQAGLKSKYPNIRQFVETDCKDATGIERLRRTIERETDELDDLRANFPASWFQIKDRLADMSESFLRFDEYQNQCQQLGENDPKEQQLLATFLHRLGIALNYSDDARLNDTHVLKPEWVTRGIYKIINSERLSQNRGEFHLGALNDILNPAEYPSPMPRFLVDLMKKFYLCFSYPDDESHYLIPQLLEKEEPPEVQEFVLSKCLNFQYHYKVTFEGLLPSFTVRAHDLIQGKLRWRTGVILSYEGCRALVRADLGDKKVFISVDGPMANRRRLLTAIRSHFDSIHGAFKSLEVEEMVPVPQFHAVIERYKDLIIFEKSGMTEFVRVIDGEVKKLRVQELLNGIETMDKTPIRVFISYSHKDEKLREKLETHLSLLSRTGTIGSWTDRKIGAGQEWANQIDENLEKADIILLLISADFINSDYCYDKEMKRALERHGQGNTVVIPVILRACDWHAADFGRLQSLPRDGKAVASWPNRDNAWVNVAEGIRKVAEAMQGKDAR